MAKQAELQYLRPWRFEKGDIYRMWPAAPCEVVQHGKYFLRWIVRKDKHYSNDRGIPQISIDEISWLDLQHSYHWNRAGTKPAWYDEEELEAEIEKGRKVFLRKRANEMAKKRRIALKKEAEETGQDLAEYTAEKRAVRQGKAHEKRNIKKAGKLVKQTNNKMKIAMELKDLRDAVALLQNKLEDTDCDLLLPYVGSRIHKVREATWILGQWSKERKKE